jgi:hypothetical protein
MVNSYVVHYPAIVDVQKRSSQIAAENTRKQAAGAPASQVAKPVL